MAIKSFNLLPNAPAAARLYVDARGNISADSRYTYDDQTGAEVNSGNLETGITASTTQTQVGGTALTKQISVVETVANANDTVTLPVWTPSLPMTVINAGANTLKVYPGTGCDLGAGANTSTTIAAGASKTFYPYSATAALPV